MNRYQSIISAIISAICIFVLPILNKNGIIVDESTASEIVILVIGIVAFLWTAWKNHNITDSAYEAHLIMKELKEFEGIEEGEE